MARCAPRDLTPSTHCSWKGKTRDTVSRPDRSPFAALDAGALAIKDEAREVDEEMWTSTYARLPAETHPHIAATAHLLADRMNLSAYPVVLGTLLDRAETRLVSVRNGGNGRAA
ncbi:hypothetical protein GCM10010207_62310 [Streptomyces atratus]|uniref:hypothetical protein n=1 Tax=Streptomyces atratus TaxID=1893 RepID=UPI0019852EC9|nr:hypothetical protein GCM10010207_62310 [Streptomyces atratus]